MAMTNKDYDELIKQGLAEYFNLEFSDVPPENEIEHEFSEKYLREKEKLIRKVGTSYWKYVNTVAKRAAVIIVTFIIAFSSLMSVEAVREKLVDFVYTIFETFTEVDYKEQIDDSNIEKYYTADKLDDVYFVTENRTKVNNTINWFNSEVGDIYLSQYSNVSSQIFNSENAELTETIINDTPCLVCENEVSYFCYWEFDGYRFELIYPVELGEDFKSTVVGHLVEAE